MPATRIGSLFSGAGGLDMAVEQVFGGHTVWHCENDAAASKVLAARWPGVPNHTDITAVDWAQVEPVDILCGGWPCQPFSLAGKRKGADDERALWPHVARAVRMVRPRIVVLENVSAVLGPEFQRVANDLAALGYDIAWTCLRASDVGAPHRRERVFVVATDTERIGCDGGFAESAIERESGQAGGSSDGAGPGATVELLPTPSAARSGRNQSPSPGAAIRPSLDSITDLLPTPTAQSAKHDADDRGHGTLDDSNLWSVAARIGKGELLPTPRSADGNGGGNYNSPGHQDTLPGTVRLLPTPLARDGRQAAPGDYARNTPSLAAVDFYLPTPTACDSTGGGQHPDRREGHTHQLIDQVLDADQWGKYANAIRRWESLTRLAPAPTEPNKNGNPRLSAAFSQWLMGWPAGWVTDVPGISRNDALRIIGNGVVPQQAQAAIRWLLNVSEAVA